MTVLKKVTGYLISILLWVVILIAALFSFTTLATRNNNKVANLGGFTPLVVLTDSMVPTFSSGDLIIIKKCDASELQVGDIVTFHTIIENEYALNTHRIVGIDEFDGTRTYSTKGDNNDINDIRNIIDGDIVGKYVWKSTILGHIISFLSSSVGFLVVIVLPMLCFFIYQIYHLVMVSINLKKAIAVEEASEKFEQQEALKEEAEKTKAELEQARAELEELKRLKEEAKKEDDSLNE